jgi:hypothetical protein
LIPNLTAILTTLLYTGILSHLLPLGFFLIFKRNNREKALRVILFYILYCIVNEGLSFYLQSHKSQSTITLFAFYTITEYSLFCYFFYLVLPTNKIKKIVPYVWFGFLLFAFIDIYFVNEMGGFDSFAIGIESIIIIVFCIIYLYLQIKNANDLLIYSTFNFWVIISFLIYFAGTFFLYIMTENMIANVAFQKLYFIINISFNILKNLLLSVAMTMKINKTNDPAIRSSTIPDLDDGFFFKQPH